MANNQINFNINFKTNTSGLKQARDAIDQITGKLTGKQVELFNPNSMKSGIKMINEAMNAAGRFEEAMTSAYNVKIGTVNLERFNQELAKNGTSIQDVRDKMLALGPAGEQSYAKMASGLMSVRYETVETTTLLDKLGDSLRRALLTFTSLNIINKVKGSIGEAYGYVKNLDTSLNQIRIVTGKSADEMERFANTANKAAASLGKATTDYTKASTTFYQQGLSDTEVEARTRVTLMASNTTGADTKQVADQLTAIWNGFNVGAEDAEHYIDVVAAVAKSTASNLDEMATAMSKVASMADSMGVSEEQLAAQMSTVIAVTRQAPESVGTAFKTIYARIADIKAGSEDAEISLGNYSGQLAALGINVLDAAGNLKDMGQIIEEVGASWQNYSKEQQVAIAGIMGGQRQVNQLRALFDNWDKYTKTMEVAANAEGELQKEQDIFMESAQGQLQKLRTEWEGVLDSLLSSDDIIKVAKAISPLITGLEKMVDAFGGGIGILQKFSPLLLQIVSPQIAQSIGKMANSFSAAKTNAKLAAQQVEIWNSSLKNTQFNDKYSQSIQNIRENYIRLINTMSAEERNSFEQSMDRFVNTTAPQVETKLQEILDLQGKMQIQGLDLGGIKATDDIQAVENKIKEIDDALQNLKTRDFFKGKNGKTLVGADVFRSKDFKEAEQELNRLKIIYGEELPESVKNFKKAMNGVTFSATADDVKLLEQAYKDLIKDGLDSSSESFKQLKQKMQDYIKSLQNAEQQQDKFNAKFKQLNAQYVAQTFLTLTQAVASFVTIIQQVKNIGQIWSEEDITTGEKIAQTITTVASVAAMATSVYRGYAAVVAFIEPLLLKKALSHYENVKAELSDAAATAIDTAAKEGDTRATLKAIAANTAFLASLGPILVILALLASALTVIIILINKHKKTVQEYAKTVDLMNQKIDEIRENIEKTKQTIEDVNNAMKNFKDGISKLEEIKKGTKEWADAVKEVNDNTIELINKYPELAKFASIGADGVIKISDEGFEYLSIFYGNQLKEEQNELYQQEAELNGLLLDGQGKSEQIIESVASIKKVDKTNLENYINTGYIPEGMSDSQIKELKEAKSYYEAMTKVDATSLRKGAELNLTNKMMNINGVEEEDRYKVQAIISDKIDKAIQEGMSYQEAISFVGYGTNILSELKTFNEDYENTVKPLLSDMNILQEDILTGQTDKITVAQSKNLLSDTYNMAAGYSTNSSTMLDPSLAPYYNNMVKMNKEISELIGNRNIDDNITVENIKKMDKKGFDVTKVKGENANEIIEILTSDDINWTKPEEAMSTLNIKLKDIGKSYETLEEDIQGMIDGQIAANGIWGKGADKLKKMSQAMGLISKMNFGDEIKQKDYDELISKYAQLEQYFDKTADGKYLLNVDSAIVVKELQTIYDENVKKYDNYRKQIKKINSGENNEAIIGNAMIAFDSLEEKDAQDFAELLSGYLGISVDQITDFLDKGVIPEEFIDIPDKFKESFANAFKQIEQDDKDFSEELILNSINTVAELDEAIEKGRVNKIAAEQKRSYVENKQISELGLDRGTIQKIAEDAGKTFDQVLSEAAGQIQGKQISESWNKIIEDLPSPMTRLSGDNSKAVKQFKDEFQKVFGKDADFIDLTFVENYEKALGGSEQALAEIKDALEKLPNGNEIWKELEKNVEKYRESLVQTRKELEKTALEQQKTALEAEKNLIQNQRGKIEDQMSHATGQEYLELQKKRNEQIEKEYNKLVDIQKINLDLLKCDQAIAKAKFAIATAENTELQNALKNKTNDEIIALLNSKTDEGAVTDEMTEAAKAMIELNGINQSITITEKQNQQELTDFYEKQWLTIDKILDEKRQITNLDKQINRLEKEAQFLTGEALTKNLEEQRKLKKDNLNLKIQELALQKEELEDSKKVLENLDLKGQRDKDNNALSGNLKDYLASQNIEINYDDFGGVSNLEEILNAVNGSSFADEVQNWINKINDCADATYELEDALLEAAESISSDYDEETRMKELDLRKKRLQKEQSQYNPNSDEYKNITKEIENIDVKRLEQQKHKYEDYLGEEYKNAETALNKSFEKANIPLEKTEDGSVILEPIKKQLGDSYNAVKDYIEKHKDDLNLEKKEGESDEEFAKRKEEAETKYEKGLEEAAGGYYDLALALKDGIKYNEINSEKLSQAVDIYSQTIDNWNQKGENIEKISQGKINDINKTSKEVSADESLLYGDAKIANLERQGELQKQIVDTVEEEIRQREKLVEEIDKQINEIKKIPEDERSEKQKAKLSALEASRAKQMESISDLEIKKNEEVRKSIELQKKAYQEKLKIAEEAIKRESSAQHQLKNSLKEVDRALNKVKKDQEGLSGPALIAKLQEEIALQEQKKKILEQQLSLVKAQIQSLVALYTAEMSKRFEVPISFVVDENGVANLDELYASVAKMPEKLQAEGQQAIQSAISNLNSLASNMSSIQSSIDGMTDSIESLNKKIKETKEAEAFRLKDEKWYKIDQELKSINKELARLQRLQKHLVGDALIKNLTQQQELLEKQAQAQANKLATMKAELQVMQQMLAMQGVMFDSDGLIANYATVFAQGNDKVNGYMKSYQSLYDSIQDLEEGIQETFDKKLDLEYEKAAERLRLFNAKIDIELDLGKAKREWQNFKREFLNTLNGMQQLNDSLAQKAKQGVKEILDMSARETPMLTEHVEQIMQEFRTMQAGGWSNLYGTDQETALSDLANYRQQLQDTLSGIADKIKEVNETFLQQLEKISNKFDEQLSNYEQIQSIIEHDMNLIKMTQGEQSYDLLANYYDKSAKNYEAEIAMLKKQLDYWKEMMDNAQPGTEEWETYRQKWQDTLNKVNSTVDSGLQNLFDKYENTINKIRNKLEKTLSNDVNFDYMKQRWDMEKQLSDYYLDSISKEYNIQKLSNKYIEAANKANDPAKRQKILKIMDEENKKLKEKENLTKYDVERANKIYELRMKQLELEDVANDKTKMRLRRDSEGNYRYEYVADQDKVAELKQQILDMEEEIRQFDISALREKHEELIAIQEEAFQKLQKLEEDYANGIINEEQYNEKKAFILDWYGQMSENIVGAMTNINTNLLQSTEEEMVDLNLKTQKEMDEMSDYMKDKMIKEITPTYKSAIYEWAELMVGTGGFKDAIVQAMQESEEAVTLLKQEYQNLAEIAGQSLEAIINGADPTIDMMYDLIGVNDDLINKYQEELDAISDLISELQDLEATYRDVYDAAMQAVDAALELRRTEMDYNDNSNVSGSGAAAVGGYSASSAKPSTSTSSSGSAAKASIPAALTKNKNYVWAKTADGEIIKIKNPEKLDSYYDSKDGTSKTDSGKTKIVTLDDNKKWKIGDRRQQEVVAYGTSKEELEKLYHADVSLATGGYTGSWGSEGKIAMLHEKELVLNKEDTANILAAVQSTRASSGMNINSDYLAGISHSVDNIYDAVMRLLEVTSASLNTSLNAAGTVANTQSNVSNTINANFPNAGNMNEIQNALMNLTNYTSQRLHSNQRGKSGTAQSSTYRTKSF